jgi:hypothetical protein
MRPAKPRPACKRGHSRTGREDRKGVDSNVQTAELFQGGGWERAGLGRVVVRSRHARRPAQAVRSGRIAGGSLGGSSAVPGWLALSRRRGAAAAGRLVRPGRLGQGGWRRSVRRLRPLGGWLRTATAVRACGHLAAGSVAGRIRCRARRGGRRSPEGPEHRHEGDPEEARASRLGTHRDHHRILRGDTTPPLSPLYRNV